jgi:WD40 repeat protein
MSKILIILLVLSPLFQPITRNNVTQLKEVKRIGNGVFTGALATSPNGETLAVGGSIGIWLYQTDDFTQPPTLIDLDIAVDDVQFSQDGRYLAYRSGRDFTLLEYKTRREVMRDEGVDSFAFHPQSDILALGKTIDPEGAGIYTASPIIELWNIDQEQLVKTFDMRSQTYPRGHTLELAFSPDGEILASSISDFVIDTCGHAVAKVLLWQVDEGVEQIPTVISDAERVIFNSTGTHLASMEQIMYMYLTGDIILWDVAAQQALEKLQPVESQEYSIFIGRDFTFSSDAESLTVLYWNNELTTWDVSDGEITGRKQLEGDPRGLIALDSQIVIAQASSLIVWHQQFDTMTTIPLKDSITQSYVSMNGTIVVSEQSPSQTTVWAMDGLEAESRVFTEVTVEGSVVAYVDNDKLGVWNVERDTDFVIDESISETHQIYLSHDGSMLGYISETVTLWDTATGKQLSTLSQELSLPILEFSPNGQYVVSTEITELTDTYAEFKLWSTSTGELVLNLGRYRYKEITIGFSKTTFSPDSTKVAIQTEVLRGRVYDIATGEILFSADEEGTVDFTPDLNYFLLDTSTFSSIEIEVFSVDTGDPLGVSIRDSFLDGGVLFFSPDGTKMIVAASSYTNCGGDVRLLYLWDIENWQQVTKVPLPMAFLNQGGENVTFSTDSQMLIISHENYTSFYDTDSGEEIAEIYGLNYADIAFQQDTGFLVAAEDDGTIRIYGVE